MSYSIDQFSKITGISKLVLRTWENRYNFLQASRTKTNIRFYSDELLIKALKVKFLIDSGYKISIITTKSDRELDYLMTELKNSSNNEKSYDYYIHKMIEAGITYDAKLFNDTYEACLLDFNYVDLYINIILPTFSKIGLFWLTNRMNPAQEHFLSDMLKQKFYSEIDRIKKPNPDSSTWLLFLPPNEHHEIGLLFSRFLLIQNGFNVIYLGANVPLSALEQLSQTKKIDNLLFFSISNFSTLNLIDTITCLTNYFERTNKYLVKGSIDNSISLQKSKITLIQNINQFIKLISN